MSESAGPLPLRVATVADDLDRAVLGRIADGELGALDDLYERYKTMAYSIAYRITNDATLAEDVVQDAFLGAWRNAARYLEGRGSVKTWLLSIVHHRAIDAIRRELQDARLLSIVGTGNTTASVASEASSRSWIAPSVPEVITSRWPVASLNLCASPF